MTKKEFYIVAFIVVYTYLAIIFQVNVKNFIAKWPWIISAVAVAAIGGFWYFTRVNVPEPVDYFVVKRGTVSQLVSVTGTVRAASAADLSFEKSGRISGVFHGVGDRVGAGEALVSLSSGELAAQIAQAEATARAQAARLADVINSVKNSYVNSDDAIRNKVDQMFSNPRSYSPQFNFALSDSRLKNKLETDRVKMESSLTQWNSDIADVFVTDDVMPYIVATKNKLLSVQYFLDDVALAVNSLQASPPVTQTTIDSYKAAVLAGRTNISTALDSLVSSEEKLRTAASKLALKKAGASKEEIDAQEAELTSAEANVLNLKVQFGKTTLYSPIAGIITRQDAKQGEIASAGAVITSIISDAKYQIEASVAEADIAKIKPGDEASVTLDAYGSDVLFIATVTKIDPAETIIDGVPTYKTTLQFKQSDERIKSGMTANTDIAGEKRENILFIPGRTISGKGASKTVNLIDGETTREVAIETGLRGSNGDVEILSGLKEGDKVKTSQ